MKLSTLTSVALLVAFVLAPRVARARLLTIYNDTDEPVVGVWTGFGCKGTLPTGHTRVCDSAEIAPGQSASRRGSRMRAGATCAGSTVEVSGSASIVRDRWGNCRVQQAPLTGTVVRVAQPTRFQPSMFSPCGKFSFKPPSMIAAVRRDAPLTSYSAPRNLVFAIDPKTGDLYDALSTIWRFRDVRKQGTGWHMFKAILGAGPTSLYAVAKDGRLVRYTQKSRSGPMASRWASRVEKAGGWNRYAKVFGGFDHTLYGITATGDLYIHRRDRGAWRRSAKKIGSGWHHFRHVVAAKRGKIWAVDAKGLLHLYEYTGGSRLTASWAPRKTIGRGFQRFTAMFSDGYMLHGVHE